MSNIDSVTSSAVAAGDVDTVQSREQAIEPLYGATRSPNDPAIIRALEDVAPTPTIGAIAAIEMARMTSGWTVNLGASNGLARYNAFYSELIKSGWFVERKTMAAQSLPSFNMDNPVAWIETIVAASYPGTDESDRRQIARALLQSLAHTLGPDGVPAERVEIDNDLLGKPKVLERRVTTVASSALNAAPQPTFQMHWRTVTFVRTKDGKDAPKAHRDENAKNHHLVFDLNRWETGDRSVLLEYYRHVEEWLSDYNSKSGRARQMSCFASILDS